MVTLKHHMFGVKEQAVLGSMSPVDKFFRWFCRTIIARTNPVRLRCVETEKNSLSLFKQLPDI